MARTPKETVSYAQNYEDIYLNVILGNRAEGFYIDVGANDPVTDSVTKFFYDKGWSGINIEPNRVLAESLIKARKRDTTLQLGVSDKAGKITFRDYTKRPGWSTFSSEVKKDNEQEKLEFTEYSVPVMTLADIFDMHASKISVDFLKVDVEGLEYQVLAGNDWKKYRPKVVVVEANHMVKDWRALLKNNDYVQVFFDGLNEYYVSKEFSPEVDFAANYTKYVTDAPPVISLRNYQIRQHFYVRELDLLNQKYNHLRRRYRAIVSKNEWIFNHPILFALSRLYHKYIKRDQIV